MPPGSLECLLFTRDPIRYDRKRRASHLKLPQRVCFYLIARVFLPIRLTVERKGKGKGQYGHREGKPLATQRHRNT